jgi:hypothetical protein
MVITCRLNSKTETREYSTPAKEDRCEGDVMVCVSCCVVRSKTQRPRREMERKKKSVNARSGREVVRGVRRRDNRGWGVGGGERDQSAKTTGICGPG